MRECCALCSRQGTDGLARQNWIDNLHFAKLNYDLPGAPDTVKVHSGFYRAWAESDLKPNVTAVLRSKVPPRPPLPPTVDRTRLASKPGSLPRTRC